MKILLAASILAISVFVNIATYYFFGSARELGWWGVQSPVPPGVIAAVIMLIGILLGCLFRRLKAAQSKVNILKEILGVLQSPSFWAAICVAPLVFLSVFYASGDSPLGRSAYILAFQNGFFCEAVFDQLFTGRFGNSAATANSQTPAS